MCVAEERRLEGVRIVGIIVSRRNVRAGRAVEGAGPKTLAGVAATVALSI